MNGVGSPQLRSFHRPSSGKGRDTFALRHLVISNVNMMSSLSQLLLSRWTRKEEMQFVSKTSEKALRTKAFIDVSLSQSQCTASTYRCTLPERMKCSCKNREFCLWIENCTKSAQIMVEISHFTYLYKYWSPHLINPRHCRCDISTDNCDEEKIFFHA